MMKKQKASAISVGRPRKEPGNGFLISNPERAAIARERKKAMVAESNTATPDEPRKSQAMQDFETLIERVASEASALDPSFCRLMFARLIERLPLGRSLTPISDLEQLLAGMRPFWRDNYCIGISLAYFMQA